MARQLSIRLLSIHECLHSCACNLPYHLPAICIPHFLLFISYLSTLESRKKGKIRQSLLGIFWNRMPCPLRKRDFTVGKSTKRGALPTDKRSEMAGTWRCCLTGASCLHRGQEFEQAVAAEDQACLQGIPMLWKVHKTARNFLTASTSPTYSHLAEPSAGWADTPHSTSVIKACALGLDL